MKKETFVLDTDLDEKTKSLSDEEVGKVFRKILKYVKQDAVPKLTEKLEIVFDFIRVDIDKNNQKYQEKCEKRRQAIQQRWKKQEDTKNTNVYNCIENIQEYENDYDSEIHSHHHSHNHIHEEDKKVNRGMGEEEEKGETSADLFSFIQEAFGRTFNSVEYEFIATWEDNELTRYAVREGVLNNARSLKYVDTIIQSWKVKGFQTVAEVQAYEDSRKKQKSNAVSTGEEILQKFEEAERKPIVQASKAEQQEMEDILNALTK